MHGMSGRFPRSKTAFTRRSEWAAGIDRELDAFDGDFQVFLPFSCLHAAFSYVHEQMALARRWLFLVFDDSKELKRITGHERRREVSFWYRVRS